ncbi:MAG: hypothetical protein GPJ54_20970 [Candidatus Heimdallarchaeota archaeon]|nr:hypothetical protein [Candidatus Heimdallarchaeota archaeon]
MSVDEKDTIIITKKEYEMMKKDLLAFSDYQRLSSLLIWIGIAMVILHIVADLFFHIV